MYRRSCLMNRHKFIFPEIFKIKNLSLFHPQKLFRHIRVLFLLFPTFHIHSKEKSIWYIHMYMCMYERNYILKGIDKMRRYKKYWNLLPFPYIYIYDDIQRHFPSKCFISDYFEIHTLIKCDILLLFTRYYDFLINHHEKTDFDATFNWTIEFLIEFSLNNTC